MSSPEAATGSRPPSHQTTATRLLADSLYEAICGSTALTNQARNELKLLLTVLGATETHASSLGEDSAHLPVLKKRLSGCHDALSDLQKLHSHPNAIGAQSQISDIRARLSTAVFALSELNTNMMISSHKLIDRALSKLVDEIRGGEMESSIVSNVLRKGSDPEADKAWLLLQHKLIDIGVASQLANQHRDSIVSTLRKMIDKEGLLPDTEEQPVPAQKTPEPTTPTALAAPAAEPQNRDSLYDGELLADEPIEIPFLPLPPIGLSQNRSYSNHDRLSACILSEPASPVTTNQLPNSAPQSPLTQSPRSQISRSQSPLPQGPLPQSPPQEHFRESLVEIPIPAAAKALEADRNLQTNLPIPVIVTSTEDDDIAMLKVATRTKKSNRMNRLRWQITSSKEAFITQIKEGQLQNVQFLLSKGADVNVQNDRGQTPLMVAASFGHEHITRVLLEYGAKINTRCHDGQTALIAAAIRGFDRLVRMLVMSGANVDEGVRSGKVALSQAAAYGQDKIVQFLIDSGANVDAFGVSGETALGLAAASGNMKVAKVLLDCGARVNHSRWQWELPLYKAVRFNHVPMAQFLMQRRADPMVKQQATGETVLTYAQELGRREILMIFANYGFGTGGTMSYHYF